MSRVLEDRVIEDRVIEDAIRWFEEDESRYTPNAYLRGEDRREEVEPGRDVAQACAIGGVEQALWRVTGRVVDGDSERPKLAYAGSEGNGSVQPEGDLGVYWGVMHRLNKEARRRAVIGEYDTFYEEDLPYETQYETPHDFAVAEVLDVEDVTQIGGGANTRELMLEVFRAALVAPVEEPEVLSVMV